MTAISRELYSELRQTPSRHRLRQIDKIRHSLGPAAYLDFQRATVADPKLRSLTKENIFAHRAEEFLARSDAPFDPLPFNDEISWQLSLCIALSKKVKLFNELRSEFSDKLFRHPNAEFGSVYHKIRSEFGLTLFEFKLSQALLLLNEQAIGHGVGATAKGAPYSSDQKGSQLRTVILKTIEESPRLVPLEAKYQAARIMQGGGLDTDLKIFAKHISAHLLHLDEVSSPMNPAHANLLPLIDRYEFIVFAISAAIAQQGSSYINELNYSLLRTLYRAVRDERLWNIISFSSSHGEAIPSPNHLAMQIYDAYPREKHLEVSRLAKEILLKEPSRIDIVRLAVHNDLYVSHRRSAKPLDAFDDLFQQAPVIGLVARHLHEIVTRSVESEHSSRYLETLANSFHVFPWAVVLHTSLRLDLTAEMDAKSVDAHLSVINSSSIDPRTCRLRANPAAYLKSLRDLTEGSTPLEVSIQERRLAGLKSDETWEDWAARVEVPEYRKHKTRALLHFENGEYESAKALFGEISTSEISSRANFGLAGVFQCLLRAGLLREAVILAGEHSVRQTQLHLLFDIKTLIEACKDKGYSTFSDTIYFPVLFHVYTDQIDVEAAAHQSFINRNFLNSIAVKDPIELTIDDHGIEAPALHYFLANCCNELALSLDVESPKSEDPASLLSQRFGMLGYLSSQQKTAVHVPEQLSIARRLVLDQAIQYSNQRRIILNLARLKGLVSPQVKVEFDYFVADLGKLIGRFLSMPHRHRKSTDPFDHAEICETVQERNARVAHLNAAIRHCLSSFCFNLIEGLDTVLSKTIRHGWIANELRSSFNAHEVICLFNDRSHSYEDVPLWSGRYSTTTNFSKFNKGVRQFSSDFDALVSHLCEKKLKIRHSTGNEEGLFTFDTKHLYKDAKYKVLNGMNFGEFVSYCFEQFLVRLAENLTEIRRYMECDFAPAARRIFDDLEGELRSHDSGNHYSQFKQQFVHARTEFESSLKVCTGWFNLGKQITVEPFSLLHAITIGSVMADAGGQKRLSLAVTNNFKARIKGQYLDDLALIFGNLLHNCLKNSGLRNYPIPVTFVAERVEGRLSIICQNPVAPEAVPAIRERLNIVEQDLRDDRSARVREDKLSGLIKIAHVLRYQIGGDAELRPLLDEAGATFRVEISIDPTHIVA